MMNFPPAPSLRDPVFKSMVSNVSLSFMDILQYECITNSPSFKKSASFNRSLHCWQVFEHVLWKSRWAILSVMNLVIWHFSTETSMWGSWSTLKMQAIQTVNFKIKKYGLLSKEEKTFIPKACWTGEFLNISSRPRQGMLFWCVKWPFANHVEFLVTLLCNSLICFTVCGACFLSLTWFLQLVV